MSKITIDGLTRSGTNAL